jgi:hypothetical protein
MQIQSFNWQTDSQFKNTLGGSTHGTQLRQNATTSKTRKSAFMKVKKKLFPYHHAGYNGESSIAPTHSLPCHWIG